MIRSKAIQVGKPLKIFHKRLRIRTVNKGQNNKGSKKNEPMNDQKVIFQNLKVKENAINASKFSNEKFNSESEKVQWDETDLFWFIYILHLICYVVASCLLLPVILKEIKAKTKLRTVNRISW